MQCTAAKVPLYKTCRAICEERTGPAHPLCGCFAVGASTSTQDHVLHLPSERERLFLRLEDVRSRAKSKDRFSLLPYSCQVFGRAAWAATSPTSFGSSACF